MYSALNKLSEYIYFQTSKSITSYTFLFVFKIAESLISEKPGRASPQDYIEHSPTWW